MNTHLIPFLNPGNFVDSDHPAVRDFAAEHARGADHREKAVSLYYAVRDRIRYNPFQNFTADDAYRASSCLERNVGWCVSKAALLAAGARASGIPARVGFADVKNHLTTPELTAKMGTDLFVYHGYTELCLDGTWVKATPAFNLGLCQRFRVKPLEFDGRADSIFHPFDEDDRRHMEYVRWRGEFADVPADEIRRVFRETYPELFNLGPAAAQRQFA
jgi:transglutaminase-like putative cysteine protease